MVFLCLSSNLLTAHVREAAESGGLRTEGLVWVQFCCKKAKDAREGRINKRSFFDLLTTHVRKAAESGGLRTEGLVWVQFCCKKAKDARVVVKK